MILQKRGKKHIPRIYAKKKNPHVLSFRKKRGYKKIQPGRVLFEITFYKFPTRGAACHFYDGLTNHPLHTIDQVGIAICKKTVAVANYDSETKKKRIFKVKTNH